MTMLHVLQHALGRDEFGRPKSDRVDYRNHFVAGEGSDDIVLCREAAAMGLMNEHPGWCLSGGAPTFSVTGRGKAWVSENSPRAPQLSRSKRRYMTWLRSADAGAGRSFGEWLKAGHGDPAGCGGAGGGT